MALQFYLDNKKVSRKLLEEKFGKEKLAQRIVDAKEEWIEDPGEPVVWMDGMSIGGDAYED